MEERHQTVFQRTSGRAMDQDNYPGGHYIPKNVLTIKLKKRLYDSFLDEDKSLSSLVPYHMRCIVLQHV
ncbi:hypothetical protein DPMN_154560 [Dreissena polymorpha]|uniref:Uncharacterized protein n=1 Tax=Dreissena polymorpha TaxID=45954 RepID=A0A9D4JAH7_DREPO|nr:hypothetical protein DPMN_154560 [Dreissena polymorpha]